ncbi:serine hydrolase [Ekhidna sp.]
MINEKIAFYLICSLTFLTTICAQDNTFIVVGKVYSNVTKEPLPFSTLGLLNNTKGTICNSVGAYRLILNRKYKGEALHVSYVGFKSKSVVLSGDNQKLDIYLEEDNQQLKEVTVTSLTAEGVFSRALDSIPKNYYDSPHISKGFYRITSKKDDQYVHLSEAVFDLYRSKKPNKNQFKLVRMRALTDERAAHSMDLGLKPKSIFNQDVVNTSLIETMFKKKTVKTHTFILEGIYPHEGREVYIISFDLNDGVDKLGFKGKVFIDTEDFGFVYVEYGLSPKGIHHFKFNVAYRALMELFDIHIEVLSQTQKVTYKKSGKKYYLSNVIEDGSISMRSTREHFNFSLDVHVDYLVTSLQLNDAVPFEKEEMLGKEKLIEFQHSEYDSVFWNDHTIILPDTDFNEIAKKIESNNTADDIKKDIKGRLRKYPKEINARVDSILTFYNRKGLFNGNALIARDNEIVFTGQYNNELTNNQRETQFRIGSTSKTFTSMLIMQLEAEGKLSFTDTIGKFIPDYRHGHVTIEQLLSHQSGIPNYLAKNEYMVQLFDRPYESRELVSKFCSDSLEFDPGSKFQYSNSGFLLLAYIVEQVSGVDYKTFLKEQIFDPVEMNSSSHGSPKDASMLAAGYFYGKPETSYYSENVIGSGGIVSTVDDLFLWSKSLETELLIDSEKLQEAYVPRAEYLDWEGDYGYGWMLDNYMFKASKKHEIHYHPGTDLGFFSMFLKQPDEGITVILLSNTGHFPRFEITDLILNELN